VMRCPRPILRNAQAFRARHGPSRWISWNQLPQHIREVVQAAE
jgi:hypothetical protein